MILPVAPNVSVIYTARGGQVVAMDRTQGAALPMEDGKPAPEILVGGDLWKLVQTWVVLLRRDSGSGLLSNEGELGKLWVRVEDGLVLKQQMTFFGSRIDFVRMKQDEAAELSTKLLNEWSKQSQDLEAINKGTTME